MTLNTVIEASQVQKGDRIRVTALDGDRTNSYEGVADHFKEGSPSNRPRWFTAEGWTLWTAAGGAVIELLDRPKPKITVPTLPNAVVTYLYGWGAGTELEKRTVVRDSSEEGGWIAYDDGGQRMNGFNTDALFSQCLSERESMHDLKVIFAGVAK